MRELTEIEQKTYNYIKAVGEIQTSNLPNKRMSGAIPNLKNMGLVEVFRKYTSFFKTKKKKYVRIKNQWKVLQSRHSKIILERLMKCPIYFQLSTSEFNQLPMTLAVLVWTRPLTGSNLFNVVEEKRKDDWQIKLPSSQKMF